MSYLNQTLSPGESVRHQARESWWGFSNLLLFGVLLTPVFGLGLVLLAIAALRRASKEYAVTNRRILVKVGLFSRNTVEINLRWIEAIEVRQSLWGRWMDYGTLIISGPGGPRAPLINIKSPLRFRQCALDAQDNLGATPVTKAG